MEKRTRVLANIVENKHFLIVTRWIVNTSTKLYMSRTDINVFNFIRDLQMSISELVIKEFPQVLSHEGSYVLGLAGYSVRVTRGAQNHEARNFSTHRVGIYLGPTRRTQSRTGGGEGDTLCSSTYNQNALKVWRLTLTTEKV